MAHKYSKGQLVYLLMQEVAARLGSGEYTHAQAEAEFEREGWRILGMPLPEPLDVLERYYEHLGLFADHYLDEARAAVREEIDRVKAAVATLTDIVEWQKGWDEYWTNLPLASEGQADDTRYSEDTCDSQGCTGCPMHGDCNVKLEPVDTGAACQYQPARVNDETCARCPDVIRAECERTDYDTVAKRSRPLVIQISKN